MHKKFYELPVEVYDTVNDVGLRGHYICAHHAARMMVPHREGLIVTTSSPGGLNYIFNVAYGINKAGCDRMAADMAIELREMNITSVSLWPGAVKSELFMECGLLKDAAVNQLFQHGESTEMAGKCVAALAADPNRLKKTGHILTDYELAKEYGLKEENGSQPFDPISYKHLDFIHKLNKIREEASL
jgi:dehydrogenase/reductase SDR family protein 1